MITYYEVLGVKEDASSKEIRKARKDMAVHLHPDKNIGVNEMVQRLVEERFLEVQDAYKTLSNPVGRKEYDAALAAHRSEGEYYIPAAPSPAAPNPPVEGKEAARCDKCRTIGCEPMHFICECCRKQIEALEKEVNAGRQLGVTACKLCGDSNRPLNRSPLSGVCLKCWGNIANEVTRRQLGVTVCRLCGALKRPLDRSPLSGVCGTCWMNVIKLVKASLRKDDVVRGDAVSEEMDKQLRSDRWVTAAVWLAIWLYVIVTHNGDDARPTLLLAAVGMVIHCALMRLWRF